MDLEQEYQFMVDFTLPDVITEEFMRLIPVQRKKINDLFREGRLVSYALSLENCKLWAIFNGTSEYEIHKLIRDLPLAGYMRARVNILTFHDMYDPIVPSFSMN